MVPYVVCLVILLRCDDHTYRARREVVKLSPYHFGKIQPIIAPIQADGLSIVSVVYNDVEAAGHGDNELLAGPIGVATPGFASWHIVQIEDTFDAERDVLATFDKREISSRIGNLG